MQEKHNWGWPIAGYLFLGGLGGGAIIVSSAADLFWGEGSMFALGSLMAALVIAVGSGLLVFDLGRPLQFRRVLSRQKAIITVGAWLLSIMIITSLLYFSFWPDFSPWRELTGIRKALAGLNLPLGVAVCIYTGILLGSMRARPFWNTSILPVLFLISGLSTGLAGQSLLAGAWPYTGSNGLETAHALLGSIDLGLISLELVIIFTYVLMMRISGEEAGRMADGWLIGSKKWAFWGGLVGLGLLLPALLYAVAAEGIGLSLGLACVLIGGMILRFLVVYSDERKKFPGEA